MEYEGLHFIYCQCGRYDHRKENFPDITTEVPIDTNKVQGEQHLNNPVKDQKMEVGEKAFGP